MPRTGPAGSTSKGQEKLKKKKKKTVNPVPWPKFASHKFRKNIATGQQMIRNTSTNVKAYWKMNTSYKDTYFDTDD